MVLDAILTVVVAFAIVVSGSYIGAKMALNTVFGRDFDPTEMDPSASSESEPRDADE
ncbi:hypothetical protein J2751_000868 [Halorubrum alkaliphilum]|uniref:Uncharacterized protein n=1 Tax=Halorubrum alkaliphilum TaxID=261290 RepID=A0A8T4GEI1_9EURY|nr:hypothetical protein [Halorubrum alkaliphilum]MBP1921871.1 hypothetical protein [Halorubrum alkaliphilum]